MTTESSAPRTQVPDADAASQAFEAASPRGRLSALADGEPDAAAEGCRLWREDADARATWHAYQLIGDVLRSEDLASSGARDAAFLAGLRQRLAAEPVPLAPAPTAHVAHGLRRLGWRAPAAVAAGFVVVAGVLVLTRGGFDASPVAAPAAGTLAVAPSVTPTATRVVGGQLVRAGNQIRDPRLDAYLEAHQAVRGAAPVALPGGVLRNVDAVVPARPALVLPAMPAASGRGPAQ